MANEGNFRFVLYQNENESDEEIEDENEIESKFKLRIIQNQHGNETNNDKDLIRKRQVEFHELYDRVIDIKKQKYPLKYVEFPSLVNKHLQTKLSKNKFSSKPTTSIDRFNLMTTFKNLSSTNDITNKGTIVDCGVSHSKWLKWNCKRRKRQYLEESNNFLLHNDHNEILNSKLRLCLKNQSNEVTSLNDILNVTSDGLRCHLNQFEFIENKNSINKKLNNQVKVRIAQNSINQSFKSNYQVKPTMSSLMNDDYDKNISLNLPSVIYCNNQARDKNKKSTKLVSKILVEKSNFKMFVLLVAILTSCLYILQPIDCLASVTKTNSKFINSIKRPPVATFPAIEVSPIETNSQYVSGESDLLVQLLSSTGSLNEANKLLDTLLVQSQQQTSTTATIINSRDQSMTTNKPDLRIESPIASSESEIKPYKVLMPIQNELKSSKSNNQNVSSSSKDKGLLDELLEVSFRRGISSANSNVHYDDDQPVNKPIDLIRNISSGANGKLNENSMNIFKESQSSLASSASEPLKVHISSNSNDDDGLNNNESISSLIIRASNSSRKLIANYSHWINHELNPTQHTHNRLDRNLNRPLKLVEFGTSSRLNGDALKFIEAPTMATTYALKTDASKFANKQQSYNVTTFKLHPLSNLPNLNSQSTNQIALQRQQHKINNSNEENVFATMTDEVFIPVSSLRESTHVKPASKLNDNVNVNDNIKSLSSSRQTNKTTARQTKGNKQTVHKIVIVDPMPKWIPERKLAEFDSSQSDKLRAKVATKINVTNLNSNQATSESFESKEPTFNGMSTTESTVDFDVFAESNKPTTSTEVPPSSTVAVFGSDAELQIGSQSIQNKSYIAETYQLSSDSNKRSKTSLKPKRKRILVSRTRASKLTTKMPAELSTKKKRRKVSSKVSINSKQPPATTTSTESYIIDTSTVDSLTSPAITTTTATTSKSTIPSQNYSITRAAKSLNLVHLLLGTTSVLDGIPIGRGPNIDTSPTESSLIQTDPPLEVPSKQKKQSADDGLESEYEPIRSTNNPHLTTQKWHAIQLPLHEHTRAPNIHKVTNPAKLQKFNRVTSNPKVTTDNQNQYSTSISNDTAKRSVVPAALRNLERIFQLNQSNLLNTSTTPARISSTRRSTVTTSTNLPPSLYEEITDYSQIQFNLPSTASYQTEPTSQSHFDSITTMVTSTATPRPTEGGLYDQLTANKSIRQSNRATEAISQLDKTRTSTRMNPIDQQAPLGGGRHWGRRLSDQSAGMRFKSSTELPKPNGEWLFSTTQAEFSGGRPLSAGSIAGNLQSTTQSDQLSLTLNQPDDLDLNDPLIDNPNEKEPNLSLQNNFDIVTPPQTTPITRTVALTTETPPEVSTVSSIESTDTKTSDLDTQRPITITTDVIDLPLSNNQPEIITKSPILTQTTENVLAKLHYQEPHSQIRTPPPRDYQIEQSTRATLEQFTPTMESSTDWPDDIAPTQMTTKSVTLEPNVDLLPSIILHNRLSNLFQYKLANRTSKPNLANFHNEENNNDSSGLKMETTPIRYPPFEYRLRDTFHHHHHHHHQQQQQQQQQQKNKNELMYQMNKKQASQIDFPFDNATESRMVSNLMMQTNSTDKLTHLTKSDSFEDNNKQETKSTNMGFYARYYDEFNSNVTKNSKSNSLLLPQSNNTNLLKRKNKHRSSNSADIETLSGQHYSLKTDSPIENLLQPQLQQIHHHQQQQQKQTVLDKTTPEASLNESGAANKSVPFDAGGNNGPFDSPQTQADRKPLSQHQDHPAKTNGNTNSIVAKIDNFRTVKETTDRLAAFSPEIPSNGSEWQPSEGTFEGGQSIEGKTFNISEGGKDDELPSITIERLNEDKAPEMQLRRQTRPRVRQEAKKRRREPPILPPIEELVSYRRNQLRLASSNQTSGGLHLVAGPITSQSEVTEHKTDDFDKSTINFSNRGNLFARLPQVIIPLELASSTPIPATSMITINHSPPTRQQIENHLVLSPDKSVRRQNYPIAESSLEVITVRPNELIDGMLVDGSNQSRTSSLSPLIDEFRTNSLLRTMISLGIPSSASPRTVENMRLPFLKDLERLNSTKSNQNIDAQIVASQIASSIQIHGPKGSNSDGSSVAITIIPTTPPTIKAENATTTTTTSTTTTISPEPQSIATSTTSTTSTTFAPKVETTSAHIDDIGPTTSMPAVVKINTVGSNPIEAPMHTSSPESATRVAVSRWRSVGGVQSKPAFVNKANQPIQSFTKLLTTTTASIELDRLRGIFNDPESTPKSPEFNSVSTLQQNDVSNSSEHVNFKASTKVNQIINSGGDLGQKTNELIGAPSQQDLTSSNQSKMDRRPLAPIYLDTSDTMATKDDWLNKRPETANKLQTLEISSNINSNPTISFGIINRRSNLNSSLNINETSSRNSTNTLKPMKTSEIITEVSRGTNQLRNQRHLNGIINSFDNKIFGTIGPSSSEASTQLSPLQQFAIMTIAVCCTIIVLCLLVIAIAIKCRRVFTSSNTIRRQLTSSNFNQRRHLEKSQVALAARSKAQPSAKSAKVSRVPKQVHRNNFSSDGQLLCSSGESSGSLCISTSSEGMNFVGLGLMKQNQPKIITSHNGNNNNQPSKTQSKYVKNTSAKLEQNHQHYKVHDPTLNEYLSAHPETSRGSTLRQRISGTLTSRLLKLHLPRLMPYFAFDYNQQQQHQGRFKADSNVHPTSSTVDSRTNPPQLPNGRKELTLGDLLGLTSKASRSGQSVNSQNICKQDANFQLRSTAADGVPKYNSSSVNQRHIHQTDRRRKSGPLSDQQNVCECSSCLTSWQQSVTKPASLASCPNGQYGRGRLPFGTASSVLRQAPSSRGPMHSNVNYTNSLANFQGSKPKTFTNSNANNENIIQPPLRVSRHRTASDCMTDNVSIQHSQMDNEHHLLIDSQLFTTSNYRAPIQQVSCPKQTKQAQLYTQNQKMAFDENEEDSEGSSSEPVNNLNRQVHCDVTGTRFAQRPNLSDESDELINTTQTIMPQDELTEVDECGLSSESDNYYNVTSQTNFGGHPTFEIDDKKFRAKNKNEVTSIRPIIGELTSNKITGNPVRPTTSRESKIDTHKQQSLQSNSSNCNCNLILYPL